MSTIRSLKPNVSRGDALKIFSGGALGFARSVLAGPLRSVADFYIPFSVFEVFIANRGQQQKQLWGIDAVNGSLDPYHFAKLPDSSDSISVETRNFLGCALSCEEAERLLITKVQRVLFTTGFFRIRNLAIRVNRLPDEIHIPYWVGFRGRGSQASFQVIDAVRRQPEGARVRRMLQDWLTAPSNPTPNAVFPSIS